MTRANIDDGDMWIAEFDSGALASIQSSYVTVGNYPGIEARIYGSEGAVIVRLVDEFGICQTIKTATKDAVEFVERGDPGASTSRPAVTPGSRGSSFSTPTWSATSSTRSCDGGRQPGRLRPGRAGPGDHQRVRGSFRSGPGSTSRCRRRAGRMKCSNAPRLVAPGADRRGLAAAGRPARLPGRPGRPAVRAARHGRGDARRALRRPGNRLRQRSPGARRLRPAPGPGREHGRAVPDLRRQRGRSRGPAAGRAVT